METIFNLFSFISRHFVFMALNGIIFGLLFTLLIVLVRRFSDQINAAIKYAGWWLVLLVIVCMPLFFIYSLMQTGTPDSSAQLSQQQSTLSSEIPPVENKTIITPRRQSRPELLIINSAPSVNRSRTEQPLVAYSTPIQPSQVASNPDPVATTKPGNPNKPDTVTSSFSFRELYGYIAPALFLVWLTVALRLLYYIGKSYRYIRRLKQTVKPQTLENYPRVRAYLDRYPLKRSVSFGVSRSVPVPIAAGFRKPMVILPERLLYQLTPSEIEIVILHELVHLRRFDDWSKLTQRVIEAFNFYQPVLPWISRQLDLEREIATDSEVTSFIGSAKQYAECLTKLLKITTGTGTTLIPGVFSTRQQLFKRFEIILMRKKNSRVGWKKYCLITVAMLLAVVMLAQVSPVVALPGNHLSYEQLEKQLNDMINADEEKDGTYPEETPFEAVLDNNPDNSQVEALNLLSRSLALYEDNPDPVIDPIAITNLSEELASELAVEANASLGELSSGISVGCDVIEEASSTPAAIAYAEVDPDVVWGIQSGDAPGYVLAGRDDDDEGFISKAADWFNSTVYMPAVGTMTITNDDGVLYASWRDRGGWVKLQIEGDFELNHDNMTIKSIERNGYIKIEEKRSRVRRELYVYQDRTGEFEYDYEYNRKSADFDDDAQEWLSDMLLQIVYRTGIGAEGRVEYLYAEGGVDAVLEDLENIDSDYATRNFLTYLLQTDKISSDDISRVLKFTELNLDSDYEKAELLMDVSRAVNDDDRLIDDYIGVVRTLDSDYETGRVLKELSFNHETSEPILLQILDLAETDIDSDYEKAELMLHIAPACERYPDVHRVYIRSLRSIDSDYEKRRVYTGLRDHGKLDEEGVAEALLMVEDLDSDYEKAEMMIDLVHDCAGQPRQQQQLVRAIASLDSDYEKKRVLREFEFDCNDDKELMHEALAICSHYDSDFERVESFKEMAECAAYDKEIRDLYLRTIYDLDSDYEKKRLYSAMLDYNRDNKEMIMDVLRSIPHMDSDYEKSEILKLLADDCREDEDLEDAFLDAVDSIDSEYEQKELYYKIKKRRKYNSSGKI